MTNDFDSIKHADTIMVIGSNTTEAHPVVGMMIKEQVRKGAKLIVCDPRRNAFLVILANRVHPADRGSVRTVRTALADLLKQE